MLAEIENALVDLVKNDALKDKLRCVDVLPFQSAQQLMRYPFVTPGVYVVYNNTSLQQVGATNKFSYLCLSQNARGSKEGMQGDGKTIGAYQIADRIASIIANGSDYIATQIRPLRDSLFDSQNISGVAVDVECTHSLDDPVDIADLNAFLTFTADHVADDPNAPSSHDEATLEQ